ncbi:glycosyltransferase family 1 protein [Fulvimarina endophytica]|uniref:Glycosyltransferase family 1 protein n=1 Tax=Fulvimarina endophytica TaxID=2293836 RepID=A0A371WY62_9HYPH|nr:glycosyltransferase family 1 protein [Fulvimarina endophytica]RFC61940.1 glycosyltransferase family 1 protein [Fulvimarina endophytica]
MGRFLFATDAWEPQVNGVVRTLSNLMGALERRSHEIHVLSPHDFLTFPCPTYPDIRLSLATARLAGRRLDAVRPDHVHIATEGPIGSAMRKACLTRGIAFTTSFHTRFPEYLSARVPVPERWSYGWLRRFHAPSLACLVPTRTMHTELAARGFANLKTWTRGVDRSIFKPHPPLALDLPGPIFLTVSRLAPEKNIEAFLDLDLPGSKLVVGDGPSREALVARYPDVHFAGLQTGETLARYYASADVFVFPSRTDTFGIVLLEALACGTPFASYREPGPLDVLGSSAAGVISHDLREAALAALTLDRGDALRRSLDFSWEACADIFLEACDLNLAERPLSA